MTKPTASLTQLEAQVRDNPGNINAAHALIRALQDEIERKDTRNKRQQEVGQWCRAAFGSGHASSVEQRGLRLAEEAIEAAQAVGCHPDTLHKLVNHIYAKPPGRLFQELGGISICLLAIAEAAGISAEEAEVTEFERVLSIPLEVFAARNRAKNEAGFNVVKEQL